MRPKWLKLAILVQKNGSEHSALSVYWCIVCFQRITFFRNVFEFSAAGERNSVVAVERLHVLHYSVDFIFLPFTITNFSVVS